MRGGNLRRFHPQKGQKGGEWWKDIGKEALKGAVLQVAKPALIKTRTLQRPRKSLKRRERTKSFLQSFQSFQESETKSDTRHYGELRCFVPSEQDPFVFEENEAWVNVEDFWSPNNVDVARCFEKCLNEEVS